MRRLADRVDPGLVLGLAVLGAAAVIYALIESTTEHPLAIFVIAPLLAGTMSSSTRTAAIASLTVVVAMVEGAALGLGGSALSVRMTIIVVGAALAVVAAEARTRQQHRYRSAQVQLALAETFQIGLVPAPRASAGIVVATRYRPGEHGLMIGGDFVDVIVLPDGATGFVIGDVTGHGPRPAAFGTAVRAGWKSVAYSRPQDVATWLDDVEGAFFHDHRFDGFVTAIAGRLDPATGELAMVSAGHVWPLLIGDVVRVLELAVGPPLGVHTGRARQVTSHRLATGEAALLYTDGLIENAWTPGGRAGEDGLIAAVEQMADPSDLDELLARLGPDDFQDDVALLLLQR